MSEEPKWCIINYDTDEIYETGSLKEMFEHADLYPNHIISGPLRDPDVAWYF